MTHACGVGPWPTGHPLPPVDPEKLRGPEIGALALWRHRVFEPEDHYEVIVVRVVQRSYVWSPGECRAGGGYRHYDWSVIEYEPEPGSIDLILHGKDYRGGKRVVVNDEDLTPLMVGWAVDVEAVALAQH